jgi:uncharacterized membrane protein YkoI
MKAVATPRTLLLALALLSASAGLAYGDDDEHGIDHDRASRAVEEGRARPLAEILNQTGTGLGGEVIGVEFDSKHGRYVYEFKVVTPTGQLREVYVDAMTGEILKSEED